MRKQIILANLFVMSSILLSSGCTPHQIAPSKEEISPIEPPPLEYIAKPPAMLGKSLFYETAEQERENTWSKCRGRWVLWVGNVQEVEPALKPSRIIFLYDCETSRWLPYKYKICVAVDFKTTMTECLKQLTKGQRIYYKAKLTQRETGGLFQSAKYGPNVRGFLMFEEGEIIPGHDLRAMLVNLAYSSYEQLDKLTADAERVVDLRDYFKHKANLTTDVGRQLTIFALKLIHIESRDQTQLHQISSLLWRKKASFAKSKIEENLKAALASLHYNASTLRKIERKDIECKIRSNERIVNVIEDEINELDSIYEKDKRLAGSGIGDLIYEAVAQLANAILPGAKLIIGIPKAAGEVMIEEIAQFPLYQQAYIICLTELGLINKSMEHIRQDVVEVSDKIAG